MAKEKKDEKLKKIKDICNAINKGNWGGENNDAIMCLGDGESKPVDRFPSGNSSLDDALGGGWPIGRVHECYGPESGGKSTVCLHALAEFQKKFPDEFVALIDTEFSFDESYAKNLGVKTEYLIIHQPDSGEQALNVLEQLIENGVKLIIIDSVSALTPQAELDGEIGDAHIGLQARLMSQGLRRLVSKLSKANATAIFTNQVREKIGVMGYGEKTTTTGGRALRFYSSIRLEVTRIGSEKQGEVVVSNKVKATVKKNKTATPYKIANFIITFGFGMDSTAALLDNAIELGVIKKSGAWFNFGEQRLGQGRASVIEMIKTNEEFKNSIEEACKEKKAEGIEKKVLELGDDFGKEEDDNTKAEEI